MLKYFNIISQLSDSDKIHLLTDMRSLSNKEYRVLGIPEVRIGDVEKYCRGKYPTPISLSNTWDTALVGRVADSVFRIMAENDIGLATVPSPKIKINPYRAALSEDPFLSSAMSREYLKSAERAGTAAAVGGIALYGDEAEWIDIPADSRFINEFIVKPYSDTVSDLRCAALLTEPDTSAEGLEGINSLLANKASSGVIAPQATAICRKVSADKTVAHIANGGLCFEGSALALESALTRYKQMKRSIEHGGHTVEDLSIEITHGKAISPETLDNAVDKLLDFAFSVKRKPQLLGTITDDALALRAAHEATVLLKNENSLLPMKRSASFCILGDLAFISNNRNSNMLTELSHELTEKGHRFIGASRGYDINADRSEELIFEALSLASSADIVLLFVGLGAERERKSVRTRKISLPANQLELIDKLTHNKKKVVAILPPDHTPDIVITENCSAILYAPLDTEFSAEALADILSGEFNPSGKLSSTVYTDTEKCYVKYKTRRMRDGIKVGPFIGYRYYDRVGEYPEFPFGHGLSYTRFSYSRISVDEGSVRFTVKNEGKIAGAEIAQVYIGIDNSRVLNPQKQLCGFARIELNAGERKNVEIPLKLPEIYDPESSSFIEEAGIYTVYVGASASDIRLTQKIRAGTTQPPSDGKRIVDYIQSESNIISDNFKLEAKIKTMKRSVFNFIAGALALAMAVILKLYCIYSGEIAMFFDLFAAALGVAGLIFFIAEAVNRSRLQSAERAAVDKASREMFADAEKIPEYDANAMFVNEFDTSEEETASTADEHADVIDSEYLAYIDKEQSFASAARDFEIFAAERGCKFAPSTVRKIFASLASSRLIVTSGMDNNTFKNFMLILSNYFETNVYIDQADATYTSCDSVLFRTDMQGNRAKTNTLFAIEAARNTAHSVHLAGLTNVTCSDLPLYFSSYINYVKNPRGRYHVSAFNERNAEASYYIPQNLWFVLNLADGETPEKLPDFISEVATVNFFMFDECEASSVHTQVRKFSYYQLDYLSEKAASKFAVSEESWKKVDRLEEYASSLTDFRIGNKMWLCLERFASVFMACDGEMLDALDEAVCAKLMPSLIAALAGKHGGSERPIDEVLDLYFGDERANACKRMAKLCGGRI